MTSPLTIRTSRRPDGTRVLTAAGEIDQSNAADLTAALAEVCSDAGPALVTVDLTDVGYLDSAGLAALFPYADRIEIRATPLIGPVLTISGLSDLSPVHGL